MAKEFEGKQTKAEIIGDIISDEFQTRQKKTFLKYRLPIKLEDGTKGELSNLMRSDLNDLVEFYGNESETWKGKTIVFESYKNDNGFFNWAIFASLKVSEEVLR